MRLTGVCYGYCYFEFLAWLDYLTGFNADGCTLHGLNIAENKVGISGVANHYVLSGGSRRARPDHRRHADGHRDRRGRPSVLDFQPADGGVTAPPCQLAFGIVTGVLLDKPDGFIQGRVPVQIVENLLTLSLKLSITLA